jgi:magnesium transporter
MNFRHMPELGWAVGYPIALGSMIAAAIALYLVFKRKEWL